MKTSIQVLSKKLREQEVTILAVQGDENSEVVRLKFKEMPDAEFDALEAQFRGRVGALGKFLKDINAREEELKSTLSASEQGLELSIAQKENLQRYKNLSESLNEARREIVSKSVIGHNPLDFELTDLPTPEDSEELRAEIYEILFTDFDATHEAAMQAFADGYYRLPFRGQEWEYESKGQLKKMPGCHPSTIRAYEKFKPGARLLHSICDAVLMFHKLTLKSAETIKLQLRAARIARRGQGQRCLELVKLGLIRPEQAEFLVNLDSYLFEPTVACIVTAATSTIDKFKAGITPKLEIKLNGEVVLPPSA